MRLCDINEHTNLFICHAAHTRCFMGGLMRGSSFHCRWRNVGEYVIIIHPSARDWKLFMYENNDVRRKGNYFEKNNKKDENAVERMSV